MKKKVIYTGAFRFPDRDAAAARVLSIGKVLRNLQYEVVFAGWEFKGRVIDKNNEGTHSFQGFEYHSMDELGETTNRSFYKKAKDYLTKGQKTLTWLKKQDSTDLFAIIVYNSNTFFLNGLIKYCKENSIHLIADVTEWYNGRHLPMGRFGIPALDSEWRMKRINLKIKNLIVIGSFLENYYNNKGCNTIKIPPLVDFAQEKWAVANSLVNKELTLVYAGSPGRKDFIGAIIEAILLLKERGYNVFLNIYGLNIAQAKKYAPNAFGHVDDLIKCHGRIPQEKVPEYLVKADYSILLRPNKKYAHAGFSTKLVESLSAGVPVISNSTGDIKVILKDNKNGILIDAPSAKSLLDCLLALINEKAETHKDRRIKARGYALNEFNYENYTLRLKNYLLKLQN